MTTTERAIALTRSIADRCKTCPQGTTSSFCRTCDASYARAIIRDRETEQDALLGNIGAFRPLLPILTRLAAILCPLLHWRQAVTEITAATSLTRKAAANRLTHLIRTGHLELTQDPCGYIRITPAGLIQAREHGECLRSKRSETKEASHA